jgi:hypothetical protein
MEAGIRSLLVNTPAPVLSTHLLQLAKKAAPESKNTLPGLVTILLSAFSSLFILISWSSFFQIVHTWVLIAIAKYPRQITYVNSNKYHTFAIRSDSGLLLWQQKRYQRHNLLPAATLRWSGVGFIGAGISYVSAIDFCRFTASA